MWNNLELSALESGIQLKESGIPLTIGIRNLHREIQNSRGRKHSKASKPSQEVLEKKGCDLVRVSPSPVRALFVHALLVSRATIRGTVRNNIASIRKI